MIETKEFFPTPKTVEISLPHLKGLSILHLSDLHISKKTSLKKIDRLISTANSLNPDIIVITGDIIDDKPKEIEDKLMLFKMLKTDTYFISGNHDLVYGVDELAEMISDWNIHFLDNRSIKLTHNNESYYLTGIADRFSKFFKRQRKVEVRNNNLPMIFLAHQPKDYKIAQKFGASLFLAGHTHGGQIFPFNYVVKLVQPFLAGLHKKGNMTIYVSRGFGNWGVDMRFLAPSEITLLKIKGES